jgi:hypothetical protein
MPLTCAFKHGYNRRTLLGEFARSHDASCYKVKNEEDIEKFAWKARKDYEPIEGWPDYVIAIGSKTRTPFDSISTAAMMPLVGLKHDELRDAVVKTIIMNLINRTDPITGEPSTRKFLFPKRVIEYIIEDRAKQLGIRGYD